jgi:hypothetical protein
MDPMLKAKPTNSKAKLLLKNSGIAMLLTKVLTRRFKQGEKIKL